MITWFHKLYWFTLKLNTPYISGFYVRCKNISKLTLVLASNSLVFQSICDRKIMYVTEIWWQFSTACVIFCASAVCTVYPSNIGDKCFHVSVDKSMCCLYLSIDWQTETWNRNGNASLDSFYSFSWLFCLIKLQSVKFNIR